MSDSDSLVEIPFREWSSVRDLYKIDWPRHITGYNTLNNFIRWFEKDPKILSSTQIYSLNGDWSDGTFVAIEGKSLIIQTCSEDRSKVSRILACIDWTEPYSIYGFVDWFRKEIVDFVYSRNIPVKRDTETILYYLSKEEAMKFDVRVPEGFEIRPLSEDDADTVNSFWFFRSDKSVHFVKNVIMWNPSVGLIDKENNELIAWCLRVQIGLLALLYVKEKFQRRGFGSLLIKELSEIVAGLGEDICAAVVPTNTPSRTMFKNLGFKEIDKIYWIEIQE